MKLIINTFFIILIMNSCTLYKNNQVLDKNKQEIDNNKQVIDNDKQVVNSIIEKKQNVITNIENDEKKKLTNNIPIYIVGDPYYIEGVEHIPQENHSPHPVFPLAETFHVLVFRGLWGDRPESFRVQFLHRV